MDTDVSEEYSLLNLSQNCDFSPRRSLFNSTSVHMGFVMDVIRLEQGSFFRVLRFSPTNYYSTIADHSGRAPWLSHEKSSPTRTLGSRVRIPLKAWMSVLDIGFATGWSPVQGVLPNKIKKLNWNEALNGRHVLQVEATGIEEKLSVYLLCFLWLIGYSDPLEA
jgi:hypothetical protein